MTMDRFHIPPAQFNLQGLRLTGPEAHHCVGVMRHREGDSIVVFDGQGLEVMGKIVSLSKNEVVLSIQNQSKTPPLPCAITLAQAIPKGKNMEAILQKATELGAHRIVPLLSARTVVHVDEDRADSKAGKWQHTVIEAAKQCGTNWVPRVDQPVEVKRFFDEKPRFDLMLIASLQPDARHFKKVLADVREEGSGRKPSSVLILIGPEGDFTPAEISLAKGAGCQPITLGPQVLRCETAAIYTLSLLSYELQS
ncbi:MAG: 16S rRNA (uracil(1498)-N(3))-methyltransferase [Verrucomicrobiae bacterium]|nr:16S rRNA (uracil(1498)-N(3))-methyltransferase [Verrucomicrobiae bacterium]